MPLAFTQEDFLVCNLVLLVNKLYYQKYDKFLHSTLQWRKLSLSWYCFRSCHTEWQKDERKQTCNIWSKNIDNISAISANCYHSRCAVQGLLTFQARKCWYFTINACSWMPLWLRCSDSLPVYFWSFVWSQNLLALLTLSKTYYFGGHGVGADKDDMMKIWPRFCNGKHCHCEQIVFLYFLYLTVSQVFICQGFLFGSKKQTVLHTMLGLKTLCWSSIHILTVKRSIFSLDEKGLIRFLTFGPQEFSLHWVFHW